MSEDVFVWISLCALVFLLWHLIPAILFTLGYLQESSCRKRGWHTPGGGATFNGCSVASKCKFCKQRILRASNGDWFAVQQLTPADKERL